MFNEQMDSSKHTAIYINSRKCSTCHRAGLHHLHDVSCYYI